jgi:hypothetical protein
MASGATRNNKSKNRAATYNARMAAARREPVLLGKRTNELNAMRSRGRAWLAAHANENGNSNTSPKAAAAATRNNNKKNKSRSNNKNKNSGAVASGARSTSPKMASLGRPVRHWAPPPLTPQAAAAAARAAAAAHRG